MDFTGQVALVTGGASGIGQQIVADLLAKGARVAAFDRNKEAVDALVAQYKTASLQPLSGDITNPADIDAAVESVLKSFGQIDILVHSAGVGVERSFLDTTLEEWRRIIDIDLTGTFLVGQRVAREMIKRNYGRIINLSSTAGIRGGTGRTAYGAAKGGVITLTKVMAVELAPLGVTVNALAPGPIETALVARMHSARTREVYTRAVPADRYGTTAEVSAAALFLASPGASYVTGQILGVDGGFLAAGVLMK